MTPASCATALAALRILEREPELPAKLQAIGDYTRAGLEKRGILFRKSTTPIIPIYTHELYHTLEAGKRLFDAGVYVNPVLPPATAPNECLLRTSYMATLTEDLIDEAVGIIAKVLLKNE